jgi:hypothetical protein
MGSFKYSPIIFSFPSSTYISSPSIFIDIEPGLILVNKSLISNEKTTSPIGSSPSSTISYSCKIIVS